MSRWGDSPQTSLAGSFAKLASVGPGEGPSLKPCQNEVGPGQSLLKEGLLANLDGWSLRTLTSTSRTEALWGQRPVYFCLSLYSSHPEQCPEENTGSINVCSLNPRKWCRTRGLRENFLAHDFPFLGASLHLKWQGFYGADWGLPAPQSLRCMLSLNSYPPPFFPLNCTTSFLSVSCNRHSVAFSPHLDKHSHVTSTQLDYVSLES